MQTNRGKNTVVLIGVGHTNAHVLRMWKMEPIKNASLVVVSDFPVATYSGMMPGVMAEQYPIEDMEIDLVRFCRSANVPLILDRVTAIDPAAGKIHFQQRPILDYDAIAMGIGSRPTFAGVELESEKPLLAIKPMQTFFQRLEAKMAALPTDQPTRIAIVGGGIGTIETAFCLDQRLKTRNHAREISLVTRSREIGKALAESTREKINTQLDRRNIQSVCGKAVAAIIETGLRMSDDSTLDADIIIWGTTASPPELIQQLDWEKDERGFLSTRPTLQTQQYDNIFVVGDSATIRGRETDKAGVFAVRQGPVLWDNLQRFIENKPLQTYEPQRDYLKLVNTADGKSIAQRKGRGYYGKWCWYLKDYIDRKFMAMYQNYEPMPMDMAPPEDPEQAMRCLGCGGKIGGQILSSVLEELTIETNDKIIVGLDQPDDAAVIRTTNNTVTATVDFFASPLDDAWITGRIAALHSASDLFVMGAQPTAALATIQLPVMHPRQQLQTMRELMSGANDEFARMGAAIVGGHSIEGPRLLAGFTVIGDLNGKTQTKGQLKDGDALILSKPIGTGYLLAAWMQCRLPAQYYPSLIDAMLQSNDVALELIREFPVAAMTDVTGFGLGGHLVEMLRASNKSATIDMDSIPLLPGTAEMLTAGIESSLVPDNRTLMERVQFSGVDVIDPLVAPLFDPQTCGGLLLGAAEENVPKILALLADAGFGFATQIGTVRTNVGSTCELNVRK